MSATRSLRAGFRCGALLVLLSGTAGADFSEATYSGKPFCPEGSFSDPRKGWSNP